jgi:hypothetical protein
MKNEKGNQSMYTESQINLIRDAQAMQISNPNRAVVNSESSFAAQRIRSVDAELADEYWSWARSFSPDWKNAGKYGDVVKEQQIKMNEIDQEQTMPSWGYAGT